MDVPGSECGSQCVGSGHTTHHTTPHHLTPPTALVAAWRCIYTATSWITGHNRREMLGDCGWVEVWPMSMSEWQEGLLLTGYTRVRYCLRQTQGNCT